MIAGVVDTGEQFITGDNDTGNNFVAGDNDTGDNFVTGDNDTGEQLSPVITTPAINLLPVTRTRTPLRLGSCQGKEKVVGDKSAISPAAEVGHGRRWCHWNRHEKLYPKTPHTS